MAQSSAVGAIPELAWALMQCCAVLCEVVYHFYTWKLFESLWFKRKEKKNASWLSSISLPHLMWMKLKADEQKDLEWLLMGRNVMQGEEAGDR